MKITNCINCGAKLQSNVCDYCVNKMAIEK